MHYFSIPDIRMFHCLNRTYLSQFLNTLMAQMVERVLGKNFYLGSWVQIQVREGVFFKSEKQLFAMNPGQDLNYNAEKPLSSRHTPREPSIHPRLVSGWAPLKSAFKFRFSRKILSLAGIWTHNLRGIKPMCYKLSYPGLDTFWIPRSISESDSTLTGHPVSA